MGHSQLRATACLNPPNAETSSLNVAVCPAAIVCAGGAVPNEKSSPAPDRLTVCGLPAALSAMLRVAVRVPTAVCKGDVDEATAAGCDCTLNRACAASS